MRTVLSHPSSPSADAVPGVDRSSFLEAMSRIAMTVNIVTTDGAAGRDGLVVSAMAPVSADMERPSLLICVKATSRPAQKLETNGVFCLNVLSDRHAGLSDSFAGRCGGQTTEWFGNDSWSVLQSGAPALDDALANLDCEITEVSQMGTHLVIFGAVLAVRTSAGQPLLHANRAYQRITPL